MKTPWRSRSSLSGRLAHWQTTSKRSSPRSDGIEVSTQNSEGGWRLEVEGAHPQLRTERNRRAMSFQVTTFVNGKRRQNCHIIANSTKKIGGLIDGNAWRVH